MSMRYLFHILMSIRDGNPSTAKDYRMPEEQFRADVESKLGRRLPENVPEFKERSIYSGGYLDCGLWDLDQLTALEQLREDLDYLDENGCRTHWADSLLFCSHGNGSYFGIDQTSGEVIYLSMDGIMHGWRLGYDFASFMHHWIHVGCAGHWGQDFMLFSSANAPYIDHTSDHALLVKQWLGIQHFGS
ncbi:hypothetical protein PN4B1_33030 [Paenibacillus naphthalenovorans]|uniref:SMI1/KNR4 family protein n=1 Tax=Paenibacillus naphthalenovorans TaxID=162209 RepID=UPI0010B34AF4|nr:SMI1/KNR4 family protein [Paenibacillus naphthalenovorans]GCL73366.1 hypothetical protein PN4B1_33030 [Paenibacillus naphthalenovorans]